MSSERTRRFHSIRVVENSGHGSIRPGWHASECRFKFRNIVVQSVRRHVRGMPTLNRLTFSRCSIYYTNDLNSIRRQYRQHRDTHAFNKHFVSAPKYYPKLIQYHLLQKITFVYSVDARQHSGPKIPSSTELEMHLDRDMASAYSMPSILA
jgi:hypothetical protein